MQNNSVSSTLKLWGELGKVKITFAVTLSTLLGYILAAKTIDAGVVMPIVGIFLLACASSVLNHYQESDVDALMERTRARPIPSGRISTNGALLLALAWTIVGSVILYVGSNFLSLQLGLLALLWYNGIYTPLKRKTAFAVIPGSVIGAIPPVVGWTAAGGDVSDPRILIIAFFFFIWQVPHFWLLLLKYGKQYEQAGLPSLTQLYSNRQLKHITFIWTVATGITCLMIPMFHTTTTLFATVSLVLTSLWLMFTFSKLVFVKGSELSFRKYFIYINTFLLLVMIWLSADAFMV